MEDLKEQIAQKLKKMEEMIKREESKSQITKQRKELDDLLEIYLKDVQKQ